MRVARPCRFAMQDDDGTRNHTLSQAEQSILACPLFRFILARCWTAASRARSTLLDCARQDAEPPTSAVGHRRYMQAERTDEGSSSASVEFAAYRFALRHTRKNRDVGGICGSLGHTYVDKAASICLSMLA